MALLLTENDIRQLTQVEDLIPVIEEAVVTDAGRLAQG